MGKAVAGFRLGKSSCGLKTRTSLRIVNTRLIKFLKSIATDDWNSLGKKYAAGDFSETNAKSDLNHWLSGLIFVSSPSKREQMPY